MSGVEDTSFARLVSLACHDLRTPLATVHGFARTLVRMEDVGEQMARYLEMIEAASVQLTELLDDLGISARIESGRYDPGLREADTLELSRAAGARLDGAAAVEGAGVSVETDPDAVTRALENLARCALRHGGLEQIDLRVEGVQIGIAPVLPEVGPIILGDNLRDLGAAVARQVIEALGGSLALEGETLVVRLR
jgi:signal transduction histidine kinase